MFAGHTLAQRCAPLQKSHLRHIFLVREGVPGPLVGIRSVYSCHEPGRVRVS